MEPSMRTNEPRSGNRYALRSVPSSTWINRKELTMLDGKVTISRRSDNFIHLQIQDVNSRATFVQLLMTPEDFGNAVTGLSAQPAKMRVMGLSTVGKYKVTELREVLCPLSYSAKKEDLRKWIEDNHSEEGWEISAPLNSQGDVLYVDGMTHLRYTVYKFVDLSTTKNEEADDDV